MSFDVEPGRATASSAVQPIINAEQPVDPDLYSCGHFEMRWQVEKAWGVWWDIPQSAAIEWFYKERAPGVTYNYDWGNGRISCYELHFARREQVTMDTRRVRRVRRVLVETSVQALS